MRQSTRDMREACAAARNIMNGFTRNQNFKYGNAVAARMGLHAKADRAFQKVHVAEQAEDLTDTARREAKETREYIRGRYEELLGFIDRYKF